MTWKWTKNAFYIPCSTCGAFHPRGVYSDYEAKCDCGNKFIVPKAKVEDNDGKAT